MLPEPKRYKAWYVVHAMYNPGIHGGGTPVQALHTGAAATTVKLPGTTRLPLAKT
jgi:hypothetical protein